MKARSKNRFFRNVRLLAVLVLLQPCVFSYGAGTEKEDSFFGLGYAGVKPAGIAELYSKTGIRWIKLPDVRWQRIEPFKPRVVRGKKKHVYKWGLLDKIVKEYQRNGFHLQLILRAKSAWGSQPLKNIRLSLGGGGIATTFPKDEHVEDYADFIGAVVERYDGDGKSDMPGLKYPILHYEIESEAQHEAAWQGTVEEYIELLRIAYAAAKKADPRAKILLSGFDFGDVFDDSPSDAERERRFAQVRKLNRRDIDFIIETLKHTDVYDIIEIHYNRGYKGIFKQVEFIKRFSGKEIWAGDATSGPFLYAPPGYFFNPLCTPVKGQEIFQRIIAQDPVAVGWYRKEQSALTTKKFVAAAGEGLTKVMMALTAVWEASPGMGQFHNNFYLINMVTQDMEPLPVFHTLKLLVDKLGGFTSVERISLTDSSLYEYRFMVNNKPVYVAWLDDGIHQMPGDPEASKTALLPMEDGPVTITGIVTDIGSMEGEVYSDEAANGVLSISLSEAPVIIERNGEGTSQSPVRNEPAKEDVATAKDPEVKPPEIQAVPAFEIKEGPGAYGFRCSQDLSFCDQLEEFMEGSEVYDCGVAGKVDRKTEKRMECEAGIVCGCLKEKSDTFPELKLAVRHKECMDKMGFTETDVCATKASEYYASVDCPMMGYPGSVECESKRCLKQNKILSECEEAMYRKARDCCAAAQA